MSGIHRTPALTSVAGILLLAAVSACGGIGSGADCDSYAEPDDPSPASLAEWAAVTPGLHASIGSIDEHYFRSEVPEVAHTREWSGSAWRGEKVSAQIVVWSTEPIRRLELDFSDFVGANGEELPSEIAQARFVRYVLTDEFAEGCGERQPQDYPVYLYPDALDDVTCFDKVGNTARPIWITLSVPDDAAPGHYNSTARLRARGQEAQTFEFQLEILPRTLPPPSEWAFHLDLWQHPYAVARVHGVEVWSKAHWELLEPVMKMLADAGQKVITTTITERPWASQTLDPFESMVVWTKKADGSWEFDYTVFDQWVEFMMGLGVTKQINAYSLIPWTSELTYVDEATGEKVVVGVEPGSDEYTELWSPFIKDFRDHLEEKGWSAITNIAMDERGEEMARMLAMMDELAPELGIALADNRMAYKRYPDRIGDLSVSYGRTIDEPDLEYRKAREDPSTFYVCCADPFPNTFTFSDPAEATFIGWYTMAADFDGFLRWSYSSYTEDPLRDSRFRTWPAGDTYIVYPGALSSIRFERLVEGIQDAEKIRILMEELEATGTEGAGEGLALLKATLAGFNIQERPHDLNGLLDAGKTVLEELSRRAPR